MNKFAQFGLGVAGIGVGMLAFLVLLAHWDTLEESHLISLALEVLTFIALITFVLLALYGAASVFEVITDEVIYKRRELRELNKTLYVKDGKIAMRKGTPREDMGEVLFTDETDYDDLPKARKRRGE